MASPSAHPSRLKACSQASILFAEFNMSTELLSRLSSNAYEFDKREMCFHLRKSVITFAKKIIKVNGTFIA